MPEKMIKLISDYVHPEAIKAQMEVLNGEIIEKGNHSEMLEKEFANYIGSKEAIAVNSCTSAIFLSFYHALWKIDPRIEEDLNALKGKVIIASPVTYIGALHPLKWFGLKVVFPDIDEETLTIDPESIRKTIEEYNCGNEKKVIGIFTIHPFGVPCDLDKIYSLGEEHDLFVIEDIAEAPGSTYKMKKLGARSTYGCFSLNPTKMISAGSCGGIITTHDPSIASWIRQKRYFGFPLVSESVRQKHLGTGMGFKMFLPNDHAAAGRATLKHANEIISERKRKAEYYMLHLGKYIEFLPKKLKNDRTVSWYILLGYHNKAIEINKELERAGIQGMDLYRCDLAPIFRSPGYTGAKLEKLKIVEKRLMAFPVHQRITKKEIDFIIKKTIEIIKRLGSEK